MGAQSIVIIGGSSGIGLAIAKEAVDAGADVRIAGRSQAKLDEARQAIAGDVTTRTVDLSDKHSVMEQLGKAQRRRDFKTVPMILDTPDLWDAGALDAIIAYRGGRKQVWDNTEIGGPWLNLMRNSLNAQVFSF